jgi:hypothetical protein
MGKRKRGDPTGDRADHEDTIGNRDTREFKRSHPRKQWFSEAQLRRAERLWGPHTQSEWRPGDLR